MHNKDYLVIKKYFCFSKDNYLEYYQKNLFLFIYNNHQGIILNRDFLNH